MNRESETDARLRAGELVTADELLPLVYRDLRRLAAAKLAQESPGHTLQPTALVHEAYLRLVGGASEKRWEGRRHFFAAAAEAMRRILVESARRKNRIRHGGEFTRHELDGGQWVLDTKPDELLAIDECLERLSAEDSVAAEVAKLRYFAGMSVAETAAALGMHRATAHRHWAYARAWIRVEIDQPGGVRDRGKE